MDVPLPFGLQIDRRVPARYMISALLAETWAWLHPHGPANGMAGGRAAVSHRQWTYQGRRSRDRRPSV